jgi:hypothetical protein
VHLIAMSTCAFDGGKCLTILPRRCWSDRKSALHAGGEQCTSKRAKAS